MRWHSRISTWAGYTREWKEHKNTIVVPAVVAVASHGSVLRHLLWAAPVDRTVLRAWQRESTRN